MQKKNKGEEHSIERVWYSASREPPDNLPGSQQCTQTHSIYNSVLSGFQVSLQARSTSLRESLGWSNQRGSKTPQACHRHPRHNLNLIRLFRFYFPLPVFGRIFLFLPPRGYTPTAPVTYCVLYQAPGSRAAVFQSPVMPNSRRSSATQSVYYFSFPPGPRFPVFSNFPDTAILLGSLWSPMRAVQQFSSHVWGTQANQRL